MPLCVLVTLTITQHLLHFLPVLHTLNKGMYIIYTLNLYLAGAVTALYQWHAWAWAVKTCSQIGLGPETCSTTRGQVSVWVRL